MKVYILYNSPNDDGLLANHTATIFVNDVKVEHMHKVLKELSEITVKDFARLASISSLNGDDEDHVEKAIYQMCKNSSESTK